MADDVLKLKELTPEEVPALLRAESYFDFKAHPFAHQALFEQTDSVYGAILAIGDYATGWLADTIAARKSERSDLTCLKASQVEGAAVVGDCEILLEPGAVFLPTRIIGGKPDAATTSTPTRARSSSEPAPPSSRASASKARRSSARTTRSARAPTCGETASSATTRSCAASSRTPSS